MKMRLAPRGGALIVALVTLLVVTLIAGTVMRSLLATHRQMRLRQDELQAQWLAEAAVARAASQFARQSDYRGETWKPIIGSAAAKEVGVAEIRIQNVETPSDQVRVVVNATYPEHPWRRVAVAREYTIALPPSAPVQSGTPSENTP